MSALRAIVVSILLFFSVTTSASCVRDSRFFGEWRKVGDDGLIADILFRSDGIFKGKVSSGTAIKVEFEGMWIVCVDSLYYLYTDSSSERLPRGRRDKDKVIEISKDHLLLRSTTGRLHKYVRKTSNGREE
jgi:hypothetical protein